MATITLQQGQNLYDNNTGSLLGTVQYDTQTGQKLTTGGTTQYTLPQSTNTVSPTQIANVGSVTTPIASPYIGSTTNATAATSGLSSFFDTQQKIYQDELAQISKERESLMATQNNNQSMLQSLLSSRKSPTDLRNESFQSIGINPANYFADQKARIAEIDTLNSEFNSTKAAMTDEMNRLTDSVATTGYISRAQAAVERRYAPRLNMISANINSKVGSLQALQGNFNEARSFVEQAVNDAVAEDKFKFDTLMSFYDLNQDAINRLDSRYQTAFNNSLTLAEKKYETAYRDKQMIGELMLDNPRAGITITDTYDQAIAKASRYLSTQPVATATSGSGGGSSGSGSTSGMYRFTNTQTNTGAAKAGLTLTAFKSLAPEVQNFFVSAPATKVTAMLDVASSGWGTDDDGKRVSATTLIDQGNLSPAVKEYLKSLIPYPARVPATSTTSSGSGNWFTNAWSDVKSYLGW